MSSKLIKKLLCIIVIVFIGCTTKKENPVENIETPNSIRIFNKSDAQDHLVGDTIAFEVLIKDNDENILPDSLVIWTSDHDGQIGIGSSFLTNSLSENIHSITISISDNLEIDTSYIFSTRVLSNIEELTFELFYDGTIAFNEGFDGLECDDGGYIIVGTTLMKTDIRGKLVWENTEIGGNSIFETTENSFVIIGSTIIPGNSRDAVITKVDSLGNLIWRKTYGGPNPDEIYSGIESSDGNYVFSGASDNFDGVYLLKTDLNGTIIWEKGVGLNTVFYRGHSICESIDSGYIITGSINLPVDSGGPNVFLLKTDLDGSIEWEKYNNGGGCVSNTSDGGYIILGNKTSDSSGRQIHLLKTDSVGNLEWEKTIGGTVSEFGSKGYQTSDGGFIVIGSSNSFGSGSHDAYLLKTDAFGSLLWYNTFGGYQSDRGYDVFETSYGSFVVIGSSDSYGPDDRNIYLIKTDKDGIVY